MNSKFKMTMLVASAFLTFTSCNGQTAGCCGKDKNKTSCTKECSTNKKRKKMAKETENCPKCGENSCDTNCSASSQTENTSIGGITDDLCTTKSMKQIEQEAEAFKKMNAYKMISSVKELEAGYEFVYENASTELQLELADFLKLEVKCCPTYNYALKVDTKTKTVYYQRFGDAQVKKELKEYLEMVDLLKK